MLGPVTLRQRQALKRLLHTAQPNWSRLLTLEPSDLFWLKSSPAPIRYEALIAGTAILGLLGCLLIRAPGPRRHCSHEPRDALGIYGAHHQLPPRSHGRRLPGPVWGKSAKIGRAHVLNSSHLGISYAVF